MEEEIQVRFLGTLQWLTGSRDRINNGDHYHEKNVVQCCGNCNTSRKDNFTHDEWKVMIDALIKHRNRDH